MPILQSIKNKEIANDIDMTQMTMSNEYLGIFTVPEMPFFEINLILVILSILKSFQRWAKSDQTRIGVWHKISLACVTLKLTSVYL